MRRTVADVEVRPSRTPWIIVMVLTGIALVLLVLASGHWWPPRADWILTSAVAYVCLLITGITWAVASIYVLVRRRQVAWWMAVWPLIVALGVVLRLAVQPDFEDARTDFEEIAQQFLSTPGPNQLFDLNIGRFEVGHAHDMPGGDVYFSDDRHTIFSTEHGWLYAPDGTPEPPKNVDKFTTEHITGHWYSYSYVFRM